MFGRVDFARKRAWGGAATSAAATMKRSGKWAVRAFCSLVIAVLFVGTWSLSTGWLRSALNGALGMAYLPALGIGIWVSRNHAQINGPAYFVAMVVETTLILMGAWSVIIIAGRAILRRR